ncbi:potassium/proton antiporter [Vallicoccus soli]|uniref:Potassium/proton antiporter n=1 Tax=Vallicoccus soli TaxID=2339232 RepID=A0A3A3Z4F1_9ACTN|nr:potassium/proton antiporter [Vallicoccus soli]RJK97843.1 potassium/proton antiporter [Vallicoccus soli]
MSRDDLGPVLLVAACVLLLAVLAVRLSVRSGLPSLLLYVGLGLLLGEDVLGLDFDDAELTGVLGYAALAVILAEGGLTTSWRSIRPAVPAAAVLATVGSLVSVAVTGAAAYVLLVPDWGLALLLGAVVSSTDAAAVFSVLRRVPLPRRLVGMLEAEAGFNDAPVVILVVALAESLVHGEGLDPLGIAGELVLELAVGAVVGLGVGRAGALLLQRVSLPSSGLYPITVLGLALGAYGAAAVAHGSGFLAVYLAALVLGNSRLAHGPATRGFAEGVAWVAQIGLFVMLGLLVTPHELGPAVLPALGIGAALLLLARPLSVLVSATPFGLGPREQALLSWAGLRGAVPIVLATVPVVEGVERSQLVFDVVFVLVVAFTLVQGPTLPAVARALRLRGDPEEARELDVDASPLTHLGADLLTVTIPEGSRLNGVQVFELRLPAGCAVTLVVRGGTAVVPDRRTILRHGDELLVVATSGDREEAERRLRAVSLHGRLADWHGGRRGRDRR